jgi:hypothetical protein
MEKAVIWNGGPRSAQFKVMVAGRDAEGRETGARALRVWIVRHRKLVESLVNARDEVRGLARVAAETSSSHRGVCVRTRADRGGPPEPGLRGGRATRCVDPARPDISRGCCSPGEPGLIRQIRDLETVETAACWAIARWRARSSTAAPATNGPVPREVQVYDARPEAVSVPAASDPTDLPDLDTPSP